MAKLLVSPSFRKKLLLIVRNTFILIIPRKCGCILPLAPGWHQTLITTFSLIKSRCDMSFSLPTFYILFPTFSLVSALIAQILCMWIGSGFNNISWHMNPVLTWISYRTSSGFSWWDKHYKHMIKCMWHTEMTVVDLCMFHKQKKSLNWCNLLDSVEE